MTQPFTEGDRGDVVEVVLTGPWVDEAAEPFTSGRAQRLVINHALGAEATDLGFLTGLPVSELTVIDRRVSDLKAVESLGGTLRVLHVTTDPRLKVDLAQLPLLEEIGADWSQVASSFPSATGLRRAFLRRYDEEDLTPLTASAGLRALTMKDRPKLRSVAGAAQLEDLEQLSIFGASGLTDIGELAGKTALRVLELEACSGINHLDDLVDCTSLVKLNVSDCGDIASLGPVAGMVEAELLRFYGTTKVLDDDLSPLLGLPVLQEVRMRSRRSYRPPLAEVQALLPRSASGAPPDVQHG